MELPAQKLRVRLGKLPDGVDAQKMQLFLRGGADHEQVPHRQRPQLFLHFPGKKRVYLIGLFKVPRHFRQQLVAGNADVHRKAQLVIDPLPQSLRRRHGGAVKSLRAGHIHPGLVDGILLHHRRDLPQKGGKMPRGLHIEAVIRRHDDQSGALLFGAENGFAGLDAEFLRRLTFCQDDPLPVILVSRHRRWNIAQVCRLAEDAHPVGRRPGQKSGVDIHMKNRFFHQYTTRNSVQRWVLTV